MSALRTSDERERLIRYADQLILRQGYRQTTLADIAENSWVPLGGDPDIVDQMVERTDRPRDAL